MNLNFYFSLNNLQYPRQPAFKAAHSTETALCSKLLIFLLRVHHIRWHGEDPHLSNRQIHICPIQMLHWCPTKLVIFFDSSQISLSVTTHHLGEPETTSCPCLTLLSWPAPATFSFTISVGFGHLLYSLRFLFIPLFLHWNVVTCSWQVFLWTPFSNWSRMKLHDSFSTFLSSPPSHRLLVVVHQN